MTASDAVLWTDGRYHAQATAQLGPEWTLMKSGLPETPTPAQWLASALTDTEAGAARAPLVALDPFTFSVSQCADLHRELAAADAGGARGARPLLAAVEPNLVDAVWDAQPAGSAAARPPAPARPVVPHPLEYAGEPAADKLAALRAEMEKKGADVVVVSALDEVAWLLNVRGADIDCNPVTVAYAAVTADGAVLFVDDAKVDERARAHISENAAIRPYDDILPYVSDRARVLRAAGADG